MSPEVERVRERLESSAEILVVTGAGISAESGIPTFRGEGGFWRSQDAGKLATLKAFQEDPKTVWEWYDYRRQMIAESRPNLAHSILAALGDNEKRVFVISQNVDDLHERAGSREVVHIHGSIWEVICLAEHRVYPHRQVPLAKVPPLCSCGGLLRPNIVWFDEELPAGAVAEIDAYFAHRIPEILLVIGTHGTFDYIRDFVQRAKDLGACVVEVNPAVTLITPLADYVLRMPATEVLGMLSGSAT